MRRHLLELPLSAWAVILLLLRRRSLSRFQRRRGMELQGPLLTTLFSTAVKMPNALRLRR